MPRNRLSEPNSRSIGIMMARFWKPELTRPDAIIPATKYWLNVTPGAIDSENTEPKIAKRISGNAMVKTTDSR